MEGGEEVNGSFQLVRRVIKGGCIGMSIFEVLKSTLNWSRWLVKEVKLSVICANTSMNCLATGEYLVLSFPTYVHFPPSGLLSS